MYVGKIDLIRKSEHVLPEGEKMMVGFNLWSNFIDIQVVSIFLILQHNLEV